MSSRPWFSSPGDHALRLELLRTSVALFGKLEVLPLATALEGLRIVRELVPPMDSPHPPLSVDPSLQRQVAEIATVAARTFEAVAFDLPHPDLGNVRHAAECWTAAAHLTPNEAAREVATREALRCRDLHANPGAVTDGRTAELAAYAERTGLGTANRRPGSMLDARTSAMVTDGHGINCQRLVVEQDAASKAGEPFVWHSRSDDDRSTSFARLQELFEWAYGARFAELQNGAALAAAMRALGRDAKGILIGLRAEAESHAMNVDLVNGRVVVVDRQVGSVHELGDAGLDDRFVKLRFLPTSRSGRLLAVDPWLLADEILSIVESEPFRADHSPWGRAASGREVIAAGINPHLKRLSLHRSARPGIPGLGPAPHTVVRAFDRFIAAGGAQDPRIRRGLDRNEALRRSSTGSGGPDERARAAAGAPGPSLSLEDPRLRRLIVPSWSEQVAQVAWDLPDGATMDIVPPSGDGVVQVQKIDGYVAWWDPASRRMALGVPDDIDAGSQIIFSPECERSLGLGADRTRPHRGTGAGHGL